MLLVVCWLVCLDLSVRSVCPSVRRPVTPVHHTALQPLLSYIDSYTFIRQVSYRTTHKYMYIKFMQLLPVTYIELQVYTYVGLRILDHLAGFWIPCVLY